MGCCTSKDNAIRNAPISVNVKPDNGPPLLLFQMKTAHGTYVDPSSMQHGPTQEGALVKMGCSTAGWWFEAGGKYLGNDEKSDMPPRWSVNEANIWETWQVNWVGANKMQLKCCFGYLCASNNTKFEFRQQAGEWETFTLENLTSLGNAEQLERASVPNAANCPTFPHPMQDTAAKVRTAHKTYLNLEDKPVHNREGATEIEFGQRSGKMWVRRAGKYLSCLPDGSCAMAPGIGLWELWQPTWYSGNILGLQGRTGKFVNFGLSGDVTVSTDELKPHERWYLEERRCSAPTISEEEWTPKSFIAGPAFVNIWNANWKTYVCGDQNGVAAPREQAGDWEKLLIEPLAGSSSPQKFVIKSTHGGYLIAYKDGTTRVAFQGENPERPDQHWELIPGHEGGTDPVAPEGLFAFKNVEYNRYLKTQKESVDTDATSVGPWETFKLTMCDGQPNSLKGLEGLPPSWASTRSPFQGEMVCSLRSMGVSTPGQSPSPGEFINPDGCGAAAKGATPGEKVLIRAHSTDLMKGSVYSVRWQGKGSYWSCGGDGAFTTTGEGDPAQTEALLFHVWSRGRLIAFRSVATGKAVAMGFGGSLEAGGEAAVLSFLQCRA